MADLHSGHEYGLTPPEYWRSGTGATSKTGAFERELWKFYTKAMDSIKPIDILAVNADCIEGKGERSGGVELVTSDRHQQVLMAARAIEYTEAPIVRITNGTPYHVGATEDFESTLKDILPNQKIHVSGHDFFSINGCNLDVKHKIGGSSVPHGRTTPLSRARLWNVVWNSEDERQPKSDILIRCLSEDTEILTKRGWKGYGEVLDSDEIVTLNKESRNLEWSTIISKVSNQSFKEMIWFHAKGMDICVSPNHTMYYGVPQGKSWLEKTAEKLSAMAAYNLPVSGILPTEDLPISDAMIKLLAWVIAEGNMDAGNRSAGNLEKNNVRLFQRKSRAEDIREVLKECKIPYTEHERRDAGHKFIDGNKEYMTKENTISFYLKQPNSKKIINLLSGEKNIPNWLMEMSERQFSLFLTEYVKGDGHTDSDAKIEGRIFTGNKDLADRIQILLVTHGYKSQIDVRKKWGNENYLIRYVKKTYVRIARFRGKKPLVEKIPYNGFTWCVETKNGTIMIRRNGKVAIVGNSHVHYFSYCGGPTWLGITTPALTYNSHYGIRQCEGVVDVGIIVFDFEEGGEFTWKPILATFPALKVRPESL
jgi:hypothetical protein